MACFLFTYSTLSISSFDKQLFDIFKPFGLCFILFTFPHTISGAFFFVVSGIIISILFPCMVGELDVLSLFMFNGDLVYLSAPGLGFGANFLACEFLYLNLFASPISWLE